MDTPSGIEQVSDKQILLYLTVFCYILQQSIWRSVVKKYDLSMAIPDKVYYQD